jgi:riboflavin synthase
MFTGIIECMGEIALIEAEGANINFWVNSPIWGEIKVDQSIAHNGVCLTVVEIKDQIYKVTAIAETLSKTNLGELTIGSKVNLERCMPANGRFDGHIVQGHVDDTANCTAIKEENGSWLFHFGLNQKQQEKLIVNKGSICVNGVSLTLVEAQEMGFYVAIIPYTYEHTVFKYLTIGSRVNIEFDILGKYIQKQLADRA